MTATTLGKKKGTNNHQSFLIFNFIITIIVDPARCQKKVKQNQKPEPICDRMEVGLWDADFDSSEVRLLRVTKMGRDGILFNEKMPKTRNNNSGFTEGISRFFYSIPQPNQSAYGCGPCGLFSFLYFIKKKIKNPPSTFLPWDWDHVKLFRTHPHGGGFHL